MPDEAPQPPAAEPSVAAEDSLAARFAERVRLTALRRLRDRAAADDATQETLRRVSTALREGRVTNIAALPGFVFQTAVHVCQHHARSAGRESRALERLAADPSEARESPNPLDAMIAAERRTAVRVALEKLEPGDRDLLRVLYYEQAPTTDAAQRLRVSLEALRVRKHRALKRLAAYLKPGSDV
jgi:RNA polymerase sigma-70 factor (ECF subfamily)